MTFSFRTTSFADSRDRLGDVVGHLEQVCAPAKLRFEAKLGAAAGTGRLGEIGDVGSWIDESLARAGRFVLFGKLPTDDTMSPVHISVQHDPVAVGFAQVGIGLVSEFIELSRHQAIFDTCGERLSATFGDMLDPSKRSQLLDLMGRGALHRQPDGSLKPFHHAELLEANPRLADLKLVTRKDPRIPDQVGQFNYWSRDTAALLGIDGAALEKTGAESVRVLPKGYSITISAAPLDLRGAAQVRALVALHGLLRA